MKIASPIAGVCALVLACGAQAQQPAPTGAKPLQFDPATEVGFVVLNVSDMDKSIAFYTLVGLTVTMARGEKPKRATAFQTSAETRAGGLVLIEQPGPINHGNGLSRVGIRTPDAAALCKRLARTGTPCTKEPRIVPQDEGAIIGWATDPDGYSLEIVQTPK